MKKAKRYPKKRSDTKKANRDEQSEAIRKKRIETKKRKNYFLIYYDKYITI